MSQPPAFQFYASDFIASTVDMSPDEVGAYIRLLCFQWEHGSVPNDLVEIRRIVGAPNDAQDEDDEDQRSLFSTLTRSESQFEKVLVRLIRRKFRFRPVDGRWRNARLERVRAQQHHLSTLGSRGGTARAKTARRKSGRFVAGDQVAFAPHFTATPPAGDQASDLRSLVRTAIEVPTFEVPPVRDGVLVLKEEPPALTRQNSPTDEKPTTDEQAGGVVSLVVRDRQTRAHRRPDTDRPTGRMEGTHQGPRKPRRVSDALERAGVSGDGRGRLHMARCQCPHTPMCRTLTACRDRALTDAKRGA